MDTRVAWARHGLLAFIDENHKVYVTWLRCVDGSSWDYVPPINVPVPSESKPTTLSWSSVNFDLAISDELGRLHIITIGSSGTPTNQIVASAVRDQRQRPAELDRLVGLHWLNAEKTVVVPRTPSAENTKVWDSLTPTGPFHPRKNYGALIGVNGNGMLRLLVQLPDSRYTEVDEVIPGAFFVSHAAFVQIGGNSLLIVIVNGDRMLVVHEVVIKWMPGNLESKQEDFVSAGIHQVASIPLLENQSEELLTLVAFRKQAPTTEQSAATNTQGQNNQNQNNPKESSPGNSIIRAIYPSAEVSFSLKVSSESLHHSFFELFSVTDPVPPEPFKVWRLCQTGTIAHKSAKIVQYIVYRAMVVAIFDDGNLKTETLLLNDSFLQLDRFGIKFDKQELSSASTICLSPTICCAAVYPSSSKPGAENKPPRLLSSNIRQEITAEQVDIVGQALATVYSCTVFNSEQCDDILKVCWDALHNPLTAQQEQLMFAKFASETQRLLNVQLGAPSDPTMLERLVIIPSPMQSWLAFLVALGTSKHWERTPGCHVASAILHLQLLAFGLRWTMKRVTQKSRAQNIEQFRFEINSAQFHLTSMFGPVRWATDVMIRICQELFLASTKPSPAQYFTDSTNVCGSLLLCSVSRYLLRYFLRGIKSIRSAAKALNEHEARINTKISVAAQHSKDAKLVKEIKLKLTSPATYAAKRTFKKLMVQLNAVPINLDAFEKLLGDVEDKCRALAAGSNFTDENRRMWDSSLVKVAEIPKEYTPLIDFVMSESTKLIFPNTDIPNLYFHDTTWLGIGDTHDQMDIDGLRKRLILPQEPTQVCTRCSLKSIVGPEPGKQTPNWLAYFQRHCVCGGSWLGTPHVSYSSCQ